MKVLVIGAHPDDADIKAGGTAALWVQRGDQVVFVSMTNGATGHHEIGGIELARRRRQEATVAAQQIKLTDYLILDNNTGELEPSLANRKATIKLIREQAPDLILTHRPNDYHPDHRYTSQLVQDASYIVTVPNMLPLSEAPAAAPHICYLHDAFRKPLSFQPDVVVPVDTVLDQKVRMICSHVSQMFEWLPFNQGVAHEVPAGEAERRVWLQGRMKSRWGDLATQYRQQLIAALGQVAGAAVDHAEAFELCEYGRPPTPEQLTTLFPVPRS